EMRRAGSRLLEIARQTAVPAGHALAVDRAEFSRKVTETISREPLITIRRADRRRTDHDYRNRPADVGRALAGNCAAQPLPIAARNDRATRQSIFLRF